MYSSSDAGINVECVFRDGDTLFANGRRRDVSGDRRRLVRFGSPRLVAANISLIGERFATHARRGPRLGDFVVGRLTWPSTFTIAARIGGRIKDHDATAYRIFSSRATAGFLGAVYASSSTFSLEFS